MWVKDCVWLDRLTFKHNICLIWFIGNFIILPQRTLCKSEDVWFPLKCVEQGHKCWHIVRFLFFKVLLITARHASLLLPGRVQACSAPHPRAVIGVQSESFDGVLDTRGHRRLLQRRAGQWEAFPGQRRCPERLEGWSCRWRLSATYRALSQGSKQAT